MNIEILKKLDEADFKLRFVDDDAVSYRSWLHFRTMDLVFDMHDVPVWSDGGLGVLHGLSVQIDLFFVDRF